MHSLHGRVALITGGTTGIGLEFPSDVVITHEAALFFGGRGQHFDRVEKDAVRAVKLVLVGSEVRFADGGWASLHGA